MNFNVSMNFTKLGIKILAFLFEFEERAKEMWFVCKSNEKRIVKIELWCIKSFRLVVHGGLCIDDNDNIVNTWWK